MAFLGRWTLDIPHRARSQLWTLSAIAFVCIAASIGGAAARPSDDYGSHVILLYGIGDDNTAPPVTSGVALTPSLVVAPAGKLKDAQSALLGRGADATVLNVRHISAGGKDFVVVSARGGKVAVSFASLAKADPSETFDFTAVTAKLGGVDTTTGSGKPGSKPTIHTIDPISSRGAALFNSCGDVVGLSSGGGNVVMAGVLAAALQKAHIAVTLAPSVCAEPDAGNAAGLKKERDEAKSEAERLTNDKKTEESREHALLVAAKADDQHHEQARRRMLLYIAIGGGAFLFLVVGIGAWFWIRSRRLSRELNDARGAIKKTHPAWNDCVLEGGGGTLKLSGLRLANGGVVVGRSRQEADVLLDKEDISRKHARFETVDDAVEITDLGSMNKTLVNDMPIENGRARRLYDGDWVTLASNRFQFKILQRRG